MRNIKPILVIILAVVLFLTVTAALVGYYFVRKDYSEQLSALSSSLEKLNKSYESLESRKESGDMQISDLLTQKQSLESDLAELQYKFDNAGEVYRDMLTEMETKINELEADIAKYERVHTIDIRAQADLIDDIINDIEKNSPVVKRLKVSDDGAGSAEQSASATVLKSDEKDSADLKDNGISGETNGEYEWVLVSELEAEAEAKALEEGREYVPGAVLEDEGIIYPNISIYYEDLLTGYKFDYNGDKQYYPASVIKAPYMLALFEAIDTYEKEYIESVQEKLKAGEEVEVEYYDSNGDGVDDSIVIDYGESGYDLSEKIVWDSKTMMVSGSGKIQNMEDGIEFSLLDLTKYTLQYSDNVAYNQIKKRFGYNHLMDLAKRIGAKSFVKNPKYMTAYDACVFFKEIYNFTETNEKYGAVMKEAMSVANHTVLIPYSVSPSKTLHKYGWDDGSYHDAALVYYKDKPYVMAIFTDMDIGGKEVNAYLSGIIKKIDKLHRNFYN